jgi:uncharacterized protein YndB with AHSA1/START domain
MPDIFHELPIKAPLKTVFRAVSTPAGLDTWWTKESSGQPQEGAEYGLSFGAEYQWRARVVRCIPDTEFELEMVDADSDWTGTRVGIRLEPRSTETWVHFYHTGWASSNEHYRVSCNCWALYLRILRRSLEHRESVPYELRLDV